jgi:KaiC/GvpD/RAD55 family RecA-like ATPase
MPKSTEIKRKYMANNNEIKEYSKEVQEFFLDAMLQDAELLVRLQNIYNPENFDRAIRSAAVFIKEHADKYKTVPTIEQVAAATGVKLPHNPNLNQGHFDWVLAEFEAFTKRQELERAILKSADLLEKGEFAPIEKIIKDAIQISLQKDMGTDYFADPKLRNNKYFNSGGQVSTGWPQMDRLLYGGFSRGELNIFAGGSGSGKSLVMMNMALNWLQQGLSGVYISLELSEELCSLRTDAMLTGMSTKDIRKDLDTAELKVKLVSKKAGQYRVKALPAQSNINDVRAYLKEVQLQTGLGVDFVMVDYLDLLMPASVKVNPNDQFIKDKYVAEELRNLAQELGILLVTASQLNRGAVEEIEFDHSHIAGGISKINTADNVFGIFTSRAMRERGKYQIQCMKSRSSTGVGNKIDLDYSIETMRITDPGEEASPVNSFKKSSSDILNSIKNPVRLNDQGVSESSDEEAGKVTADIQSSKLKALLAKSKQPNL